MKENISIFIEKFKVPEKLKNHIHRILNEEETAMLNYLADKEEKDSDIISAFPSSSISLIESLYMRGYLIKELKGGESYYKSNTFDQIVKRFVNHNPDFQELSDEEKAQFQECIADSYLERMRAIEKPVYRVIPIEETIPDKRQLIPYHRAIYYLKKASALSVIDCICRTTFNRCDKPRRVCLALGEQANFFTDRGIGEDISVQRGLEILDLAQENDLVHSINNIEEPNFLCNCCECCCVFVQGLKKYGIFTSIGKSGFIALRDSQLCDQCEICVDKCIFEAVYHDKGDIKFDRDKCFGCGLCAYNCSQTAVKLIFDESENISSQ